MRRLLVAILISLLAGAVVGFLLGRRTARASAPDDDDASASAPGLLALPVRVAGVRSGTLELPVTAAGTLESASTDIEAEALPGAVTIARVEAVLGDAVTAGQPLLACELTADAAQSRAEALATLAGAEHARALAAQRVQLQLASTADLASADAALAVARIHVQAWSAVPDGQLILRAHRSGTLMRMAGVAGTVVPAGAELLAVAGPARQLRLGVEPAIARALTPGAPVLLSAPTVPGLTPWSVPVGTIAQVVDPATGLEDLVLLMPQAGVPPGTLLRGTLTVTLGPGPIVPRPALVDGPDGMLIYTVRAGDHATAERHRVSVRALDATQALLGADELKADAQVILPGSVALDDGTPVVVAAPP
jgi:hypothetical protein